MKSWASQSVERNSSNSVESDIVMDTQAVKSVEAAELDDLPCLESVETKSSAVWPAVLVYGGFAVWQVAMVCILVWKYRHFIGQQTYALAALIVGLLLWIGLRLLFSYTYFRTDPNGITVHGPILRKFIPWDEIQDAKIRRRGSRVSVTMKTTHGKKTIQPGALGSTEGESIVASIWQHLRRLGMADGIELGEIARNLWQPIPDDVPASVDYDLQKRAGSRIGAVCGVILPPIAVVVLAIVAFKEAFGILPVFALMIVALEKWTIIPSVRCRPWHVAVRPDGLLAKMTFRDVYVPWASVTTAHWENNGLCITSRGPDARVMLSYSLGDASSELFILSVIRHLRTAGVPQAVQLPMLVSRDPAILYQRTSNTRQLARLRQAFINGLDEPARKRIGVCRFLEPLLAICSMFAGFVFCLANVPGMISGLIYSAPDTRYFIPSSALPIACPLMIGTLGLGLMIAQRVGQWLAGPYRESWKEFCKVGSTKNRADRIALWICCVLAILSVISVPMFVCCYTRVTDTGIAMNRPMRFHERFYLWSQVQQIRLSHWTKQDHGETRQQCKYTIRFVDHTDWVISDDGTFWEKERLTRAMRFVIRRYGRPVVESFEQ